MLTNLTIKFHNLKIKRKKLKTYNKLKINIFKKNTFFSKVKKIPKKWEL